MSPIDPGQKIRQLRRGDGHGFTRHRRPYELASLKSFHEQAGALRIMPNNFNQVRSTPPEAEQVTAQRILLQDLLNLQRQAWKAATHIRVSRRKPDTNAGGKRDHRAPRPPLNASSVAANVARSIAPVIFIRAPLAKSISISIVPGSGGAAVSPWERWVRSYACDEGRAFGTHATKAALLCLARENVGVYNAVG